MIEYMPLVQILAALQLGFLFVTGKAHDWPARVCMAIIPVTTGLMAWDVGVRLGL